MIPVRDLSLRLGVFNTVEALILFMSRFRRGSARCFAQLHQAVAVRVDRSGKNRRGGEWTVFWRIVLPLIRPALAALAILVLRSCGMTTSGRCVSRKDEAAPITAGVAALKGQWTTSWNLVSAGSILAALPSVAMFFAMQKHFVAGLTFGATKG